MATPLTTSLTYPGRPAGNMMQIATPGAPGGAGTGPIDMDALYKMMAYKAQTKAAESARLAAMQEREMKMRERMQQAQLDAMRKAESPVGRGRGSSGVLEAVQEKDALMKISEDQIARNMHKIPIQMGPGGTYGVAYDWDTRGMTPGQQKMVSPQNSTFGNTGDELSQIAAQGAARQGAPAPGSLEDFMLRTMYRTPPVWAAQQEQK